MAAIKEYAAQHQHWQPKPASSDCKANGEAIAPVVAPAVPNRQHQPLPDARFDFHEGDSRLPRPIRRR